LKENFEKTNFEKEKEKEDLESSEKLHIVSQIWPLFLVNKTLLSRIFGGI